MGPHTPPHSSPSTPSSPDPTAITPPLSVSSSDLRLPTFFIPHDLTQANVLADAQLTRLQKDLLILTSLPENSTLNWRPKWFAQPTVTFKTGLWTLYNPPDVVTETLPVRAPLAGRQEMTRRMRRVGDAAPTWIKTGEAWERYCEMYGVPWDFLCEEQVKLMRLGLCRDEHGNICPPPTWPSYPEPLPAAQGHYILGPATHTGLPRKFHSVVPSDEFGAGECIVVRSNGALEVKGEDYATYAPFRFGKRWSYLPWTEEQESSCQPRIVGLRFWNTAM
ncbi:hypothetical protein P280DRAFT_394422 [Massarina eburnea CBS 473.64]|uniref:Uncharacterized protein n=1 Tax=Massarina eburnea CBS 473.64 TaxID=1395130 RepID=A0A6A6S9B6_9PLEO|nr:hypothetical protein P280DRAFT_394422 [Massarina eburnea CBS 473.64]